MNFDGLRVTFMPCRWVMFPLNAFVDCNSRQCLHQFVDEFSELAPQAICRFVIRISVQNGIRVQILLTPILPMWLIQAICSHSNYFRLFIHLIWFSVCAFRSGHWIQLGGRCSSMKKKTISDFLGNAFLDPVLMRQGSMATKNNFISTKEEKPSYFYGVIKINAVDREELRILKT